MTEPRIIRIDPVPRQFSIIWMLGSRCNYDCMYCSAEVHDKTSKHHDLETLQRTWQQILAKTEHLGLQYKISFTGGEVTTNRNFLPFIEGIKSQIPETQIFLTSNGSASLNYYQRLARVVQGISLSTHSEFFDEAKFFTLARELNQMMIRPEKNLHVNIMDEFWNKDRNLLYEKFCKDNAITYSVTPIDYYRQTRIYFKQEGNLNIEKMAQSSPL